MHSVYTFNPDGVVSCECGARSDHFLSQAAQDSWIGDHAFMYAKRYDSGKLLQMGPRRMVRDHRGELFDLTLVNGDHNPHGCTQCGVEIPTGEPGLVTVKRPVPIMVHKECFVAAIAEAQAVALRVAPATAGS